MDRWLAFAAAVVVGAAVGGCIWVRHLAHPNDVNDITPVLHSARAMLEGLDPYSAVGRGRAFDWPWPQFYPATAFVPLLPIAALPFDVGEALFVGISAGWLTLAVLRYAPERVAILASGSFMWGILWEQWSPALVAAALTPALAGLLAAKPTTGLALLAGSSRRTFLSAMVGGAVLLAIAFALAPGWIHGWRAAFDSPLHFVAPVTRLPFGPLVLLALLRWRRPETRLLVALACVPQTNAVSDVLPLFLVASTSRETLLLAFATQVIGYVDIQTLWAVPPRNLADFARHCDLSARTLVLGAYLPCLVMVLRRPQVAPARAAAAPEIALT